MQIIFLSGTKSLWLPQYVNEFLVCHKKFGPAQKILGPVKGQGIKQSLENPWYLGTKNSWIGWWDIIIETQMKSSESQFCHSPTTKDLRLHQHHISSPFRAEKEKKRKEKLSNGELVKREEGKINSCFFPLLSFLTSGYRSRFFFGQVQTCPFVTVRRIARNWPG